MSESITVKIFNFFNYFQRRSPRGVHVVFGRKNSVPTVHDGAMRPKSFSFPTHTHTRPPKSPRHPSLSSRVANAPITIYLNSKKNNNNNNVRFGCVATRPGPKKCPFLPSAVCRATAASRISAPSSISGYSKNHPPVVALVATVYRQSGPQSPSPSLRIGDRVRPATPTREGSGALRPRARPSLLDMTATAPSSLTLGVVPGASPASLIVI
jgi:hypothetical protein